MQESFRTSFSTYVKAVYPLLLVETHEEVRVLTDIASVAKQLQRSYIEYDVAKGMVDFTVQETPKAVSGTNDGDPTTLLNQISSWPKNSNNVIFVVKDYHPYLSTMPVLVRMIRNLIPILKARRMMIVFISPKMDIPIELQKEIQSVNYSLPTASELADLFDRVVLSVAKEESKPVIPDELRTSSIEAMAGMTHVGAENAVSLAIIDSGRRNNRQLVVDAPFVRTIFEEKISNLRDSFLVYEPTFAGFESVGGLENVKEWAMKRRVGFDPIARKLNLPNPRGVGLAGVPGCGKSMTAKAIAHQFKMPLFRLDLGRLFGGIVGESESNTRQVIRIMESIGSAVVLIDEVEKYLSKDATSGKGDSGTSSRMFGTLLSWMAEKTCPVFMVMTMNNMSALPPELTRKGRLDELFFVDLPNAEERYQIFLAQMLYKFKLPVQSSEGKLVVFDPLNEHNSLFEFSQNHELIDATDDFSGAEIESVIQEALYGTLQPGKSMENLQDLLLKTSLATEPQARRDKERIEELRSIKGFRKASREVGEKVETGRALQLTA